MSVQRLDGLFGNRRNDVRKERERIKLSKVNRKYVQYLSSRHALTPSRVVNILVDYAMKTYGKEDK